MKKVLFLTIIMFFVLAISATSTSAHTADAPMVVDLIAGQKTDAGDVLVWNDADWLYVKFETSDFCFLDLHLQVDEGAWDDDILTKKGNPIPGQFEAFYTEEGCFDSHTFTFPLVDFSERGGELMLAAHASMGEEGSLSFESNEGDVVYGPFMGETEPADWGTAGTAVRAYNWIGVERDLDDPLQLPLCELNPFYDLEGNWGFGLNPLYEPELPGVIWISTAHNTENWMEYSWRKVVETIKVPGYPTGGSIEINSDNEYWVHVNGVLVGTDDDIWNLPDYYEFMPVGAINTIELVWKNWLPGPTTYYCKQVGNPNGITYKGTVSYLGDSETAWGCGEDNCEDFDGRNWATYFNYTIQNESPSVAPKSGNLDRHIQIIKEFD